MRADEPFAAQSRWLSGDWGGTRQHLLDEGYNLTIDYKAEVGSNVHGGYDHDRTARYADQYAFGLGVDLQKVLGWRAASFQLTITDRNGRDITGDRVIDRRSGQLTSTQEVYGRGQMWHLTEMAYRQTFSDGNTDLRVGRFGPDAFGGFPCDFQNLMFCGNTGGAWAGAVWYNYPISQWAVQIKQNLTKEWQVMAGIFEQNPSLLENDTGFKLNFSGGKGLVLPLEISFKPAQGLFGLPGEYRIGAFLSTAASEDVFKGPDGQPQVLAPQAGFKSHGSRHGYWGVVRQQIGRIGQSEERPIEVFGLAHLNDSDSNYIRNSTSLGIVATGPFASRPKDQLAMAIGRLEVNGRFADRERMLNTVAGVSDYDNPDFLPVQNKEYSAEVYYGFQVTNWLVVRPNLQFIRHPGGVSQVDDAVVAGLKVITKI